MESTSVQVRDGSLRATFRDPATAPYSVVCTTRAPDGSVTTHSTGESGGRGWLHVVDTQEVEVAEARAERAEGGAVEVRERENFAAVHGKVWGGITVELA